MNKDEAKEIVIRAWPKWLEHKAALTQSPEKRTFSQWFIENNPSYSADISLDEIDRWISQMLNDESLNNALAKMNYEIEPLIRPHLITLLKKRQRMIFKDDYGLINDSKWQAELDYFLNRAIIPHMIMKTRVGVAASALNRRAAYNPGVGINDDVDGFSIVDNMIKILVNNLLDSIPEEALDKNIDVALLEPIEYEHFCANLLKENGWDVKVTQASGDQGIDILAEKDGFLLAIQCKKYSSPVGNKAVQEAHSGGTFYNANAFAVVSPMEYTPSARELANSLGVRLFHHDDLATLTIKDKERGC